MPKWKEPEQAEEGAIRVVNYLDGMTDTFDALGRKGDPVPLWRYRIEQLGPWGWQPIPVYQEQPDGSLVEIPQ